MIYVAGSGGIAIFDDLLGPAGDLVRVEEMLYLGADPTGHFLYGVSGVAAGWAHAWRIDGRTLERVGTPVPTGGGEPCHLVVDPSGRLLLIANYGGPAGGSVAVLPIGPDGSLGAAAVLGRTTRPGPDPDRQGESHIHQVVLGPGNEVLVVDLGADQVVSYLLVDGELTAPVASSAPVGSGPRHLVVLPGGVAVSGELGSTLLRATRRGRSLVNWQSTPSTAGTVVTGDRNYPSDLHLSGSGDVLYLANRGVDSVALLSPADGGLLAEIPCGAWPRHLAPDGDRIFVSSTNADRVDVIDLRTRGVEHHLDVPGPMCVVLTR